MTKIKARCVWSPLLFFFFFFNFKGILQQCEQCVTWMLESLHFEEKILCIWGEFLALVKLMGNLPLPCQTKISHIKRKIIKKTLYRQKINLKGHWESSSQVQMETGHCHSSFTSDLLMWVIICEKALPQSAVRFVKIGFSVWVFFHKNIWLPNYSKYHYFA